MSSAIWGTTDYEIDAKRVEEIAKTEYDSFMNLLASAGLDIDGYSEYYEGGDINEIEGIIDLNENESADIIRENIDTAFNILIKKVLSVSGVRLGLFIPGSEVTYGVNRAYWVAENAMMPNKDIDLEIRKSLTHINVIQEG